MYILYFQSGWSECHFLFSPVLLPLSSEGSFWKTIMPAFSLHLDAINFRPRVILKPNLRWQNECSDAVHRDVCLTWNHFIKYYIYWLNHRQMEHDLEQATPFLFADSQFPNKLQVSLGSAATNDHQRMHQTCIWSANVGELKDFGLLYTEFNLHRVRHGISVLLRLNNQHKWLQLMQLLKRYHFGMEDVFIWNRSNVLQNIELT